MKSKNSGACAEHRRRHQRCPPECPNRKDKSGNRTPVNKKTLDLLSQMQPATLPIDPRQQELSDLINTFIYNAHSDEAFGKKVNIDRFSTPLDFEAHL
jgi:hypothetical protein